ncbi:hypothetical protein [Phenylobacterium sp.]|uniref:hypothetical protein n=1 Tax=Phenylobacterium sp. TaxID=1871053 RepID=UPI0035AF5868
MTDDANPISNTEKRPDGDEAFQRTLENLLKTPHKPHEPLKKGREPKPAPKP